MLVLKLGFVIKRGLQQFWRLFLDTSFVFAWILLYLYLYLCCISLCDLFTELQSINQSNPVLLKERVSIPRTRRAGGAAILWGALPLDGVGSCRLFFTDDLHDTLSWVPASDKPHTFKSCFTHSYQVFFGRAGPFLQGTGLDLTLFTWRSMLMCNISTSAGTSLEGTPMFAHVTLHRTFNPLGSKCPWWQDVEAAS